MLFASLLLLLQCVYHYLSRLMGSKEVFTPERAEVSEPAHRASGSVFHTEFDCNPCQRCSPLSVVLVGLPLWGFPSPSDYSVLFCICSIFAHIFVIFCGVLRLQPRTALPGRSQCSRGPVDFLQVGARLIFTSISDGQVRCRRRRLHLKVKPTS